MCRRHWYLVPKQIRDRVWATWRSGEGALSKEHLETVRMAITACQAAAQPGGRYVAATLRSAGAQADD